MALEDLGSLLIRVTVAWLFLGGAWASGKDATARKFVIADTALVFPWRPDLFAFAVIFMAGAGGLSVLFGIFPRLGALALTIFLVPAAMHVGAEKYQPDRPDRLSRPGGSAPAHADRLRFRLAAPRPAHPILAS